MKCLDTYALVEIADGNPAFSTLLAEDVIITDLTLAEFYGDLYRKFGAPTANYWHRKLAPLCRPVGRDLLIKAVTYRIDHKKQGLSFFDCVGYLFAIENNILFVTGDKEFRGRANVEFISK
ncbi:MAG: PIN domain-containing protein [Nanoarchaeota archaeon]